MAFGPDDLRTYAYLRDLLDHFEAEVLSYCAQDDPNVRFERVKTIRDALFRQGKMPAEITLDGPCNPICPPGMVCEAGTCVFIMVDSGWPRDRDPNSWDA